MYLHTTPVRYPFAAALPIAAFFAALVVQVSAQEKQEKAGDDTKVAREATARAVAFLVREVPQWPVKNKCYSCHNNGDAAQALYRAARLGFRVPGEALADTTRWLSRPDGWEHNGGEGEFNDKRLAAIQFAAALLTAIETGAFKDRKTLREAAAIVAGYQGEEGVWPIEPPGTIGSPATYGNVLATSAAIRVLAAADHDRFAPQIEKAKRWLQSNKPKTVPDAAGVLLYAPDSMSDGESRRNAKKDGKSGDAAWAELRRHCLKLLRDAQRESGGWGPYKSSRTEPFDTAIAMLALSRLGDDKQPDDVERIARGRRFLLELQLADGSWPETTRPANDVSYAQRLSTAGWATQALLATLSSP